MLGNLHGPFLIHIFMILSTLGLIPRDFDFGLLSQKASYQLDVVHVYILLSLLIHSQQSFPRREFHRAFYQTKISLYFIVFEHTSYVKHHLSGAHHSPHHFVWHPPTRLSLNPALIPIVRKPSWTFP